MPRLLFLTTANLTTNPRLLKELRLALSQGYQAEAIAFRLGNWSDALDERTRQTLPKGTVRYLSATRQPAWPWLRSTAVSRLARARWPRHPDNLLVTALASDKRSELLLRALRRYAGRPDLIVAHNLGALYPAFALARKLGVPFGFDVEDYHPGETIAADAAREVRRRERLLRDLLPAAAYVSYAAPLIGERTLALLPPDAAPEHLLVNNCFSGNEFHAPPPPADGPLRFVWFSQNVDFGRGLEGFVPVLKEFTGQVQLTLIGNLRPEFETWLNPYRSFVRLLPPLPQPELHVELGRHDVGLALDLSGADLNRQLALTNKIVASYQAGLYLLATDTPAQRQFLAERPAAGDLTAQHQGAFREAVARLLDQKTTLRARADARFADARTMRWEEESQKLLRVWQQVS